LAMERTDAAFDPNEVSVRKFLKTNRDLPADDKICLSYILIFVYFI